MEQTRKGHWRFRSPSPAAGQVLVASTTRADGSIELTQAGILELLDLLEAAGAAASEPQRIRRRLHAVVNDPSLVRS